MKIAKVELNDDLRMTVAAAWKPFEKDLGELRILEDRASRKGDTLRLPVQAAKYPPTLYALVDALARAEIELRDSGRDVSLVPVFRQRMVVFAAGPTTGGEVIYLSEDGREYQDLAELLKKQPENFDLTAIESYAYDNDGELEVVLKEAREEHPAARTLGSLAFHEAS